MSAMYGPGRNWLIRIYPVFEGSINPVFLSDRSARDAWFSLGFRVSTKPGRRIGKKLLSILGNFW